MPGSTPLVPHMYTAAPRAPAFEGRIYVYPSHGIHSGVPENDAGDPSDRRDFHVVCMSG